MKTLYTGESRKDFLENWKSINHDLVFLKTGLPAELEFYLRMCKQNRGLPTPNIFTGGHNYHGKFEYIPIQSMQKSVEVILKIVELLAMSEIRA